MHTSGVLLHAVLVLAACVRYLFHLILILNYKRRQQRRQFLRPFKGREPLKNWVWAFLVEYKTFFSISNIFKHFSNFGVEIILIFGNIFVKFIFVKIFFHKYFSWKYFCQNIFTTNIFAKNIFSLPPLTVHHLCTTPTPSYPLFEVEGGDKRTNSRTGRTQWLFLLLY